MTFFREDLKEVRAFVFDIDGVLSRPVFYVGPGGELLRSLNVKDGFAIKQAIQAGFQVGIISGARPGPLGERLRSLGVTDLYMASTDKSDDFRDFMSKYSLSAEQVLYMGDDLPDYAPMQDAGFPVCPVDAAPEVKAIACYISPYSGGDGCVRDVIEQTLKAQHLWNENITNK